MYMGSQDYLHEEWYNLSPSKHLIQGLSIKQSPLSVTYAALVPSPRGGFISDSLKFIVDEEPKITNAADKSTANSILITGITTMTEIVDYPFLAYNSYLPNNSELIVTNLA